MLLQDHFGQPARVITFFGQWLRLHEDQQSRMGRNGSFNRLGIETVAGQKVWDDQSKFRVRIGPLGFEEFRDFLPGGRLADELMDLIRFFVRGELDFDVQLVLKADEVPMCCPSGATQEARRSSAGLRGSGAGSSSGMPTIRSPARRRGNPLDRGPRDVKMGASSRWWRVERPETPGAFVSNT